MIEVKDDSLPMCIPRPHLASVIKPNAVVDEEDLIH